MFCFKKEWIIEMSMKYTNFFLKEKPLFVRTPQSENKSLKRKILSSESPTHEEEGKLMATKGQYQLIILE
jgi:hypothetical protein